MEFNDDLTIETVQSQMTGCLANSELETIWKEAVFA
jgi:hypothetical protein